VGSYTITFTPDDVTNASAVVRVDLGASGARITELTVRAGSGDGLVPGELPGFDLGRLMRAIAPAGPTAPAFELSATPSTVTAAASYTTEPASTPARKTAGRAAAGRGAAAKQTAKQTGAKKAAKAAPGTGRAARAASGSAAGTRSGGAGRSATRSSGAAAVRTGTSRGGTGRAYRRTPTDIVEVFTQAPSATALARHYGVPRHTVQGWLRRLRAEGILPPSSRAA
jgi:Helix-turn-helix domain